MFLPDWFCSLFDIHCSGVRCVPLIGGISYKDEEGSRTPAITLWSFFFFSFKSVLVLLELVVKREGSSDGDGAVRRRQQRSAPGTRLPGDPRGNPAARSWKLLPAAAACPPGSVVSAPWAPGGALRAGTSRGCPGRGRPRAAPGSRQPRGLLRVLSRRGCGALVLAEPRSRFLWLAPGVTASSWESLRSV